MKKIIAKEVDPRDLDFSPYFDDDGLKSISGKNCACYIIPGDRRRCHGFNECEYKEIEARAAAIIEGFLEVREQRAGGYGTYKEVLEDHGINYTSQKCHALKVWAKTGENLDSDDIAEFLSIITGEEWERRSFYGYSQGDYCEVVYCPTHYSEDHITEIGKFWLGCGTEFVIDDVGGYYILDDVRWREDNEIVNLLAECSGYKPEELEVHLYVGEHTIPDYKILTV